MARKGTKVEEIEALDAQRTFSPAELADFLGIARGTCRTYLDTHEETFPPLTVAENGYRTYSRDTVKRVYLARALRAKPFNVPLKSSTVVFRNGAFDGLWEAYTVSNRHLQEFILREGYFSEEETSGGNNVS